MRWVWFTCGWMAVAIGSIGILVPGLPTTVFFIIAAWCFTRSSPRFEQWVLDLPRIGPMVRDHRAGLGMPRKAKTYALSAMAAFCALSILLSRERPVVVVAIVAAVAVGASYILLAVPTRERVQNGR